MKASDVDIQQLISRARSGDNGALGRVLELFRGYLGLLTRLRLDRRFHVKVSPSDILQDTFLEAKKGFGRFRGTSEN